MTDALVFDVPVELGLDLVQAAVRLYRFAERQVPEIDDKDILVLFVPRRFRATRHFANQVRPTLRTPKDGSESPRRAKLQ